MSHVYTSAFVAQRSLAVVLGCLLIGSSFAETAISCVDLNNNCGSWVPFCNDATSAPYTYVRAACPATCQVPGCESGPAEQEFEGSGSGPDSRVTQTPQTGGENGGHSNGYTGAGGNGEGGTGGSTNNMGKSNGHTKGGKKSTSPRSGKQSNHGKHSTAGTNKGGMGVNSAHGGVAMGGAKSDVHKGGNTIYNSHSGESGGTGGGTGGEAGQENGGSSEGGVGYFSSNPFTLRDSTANHHAMAHQSGFIMLGFACIAVAVGGIVLRRRYRTEGFATVVFSEGDSIDAAELDETTYLL
eukprot:m.57297 g.57297  ORF g.57297 m.57297 type:complete len:297 (-) comp22362_c1_seq1:267-1157(-)